MTLRRALVTGSSGFLGRHLVSALAQRYDEVDGVDLLPPPAPVPGTVHVGDARLLLPELPRYDAVFHCAARVGGRLALETGPLVVADNLSLDHAFFTYVARTRPASAAYLSSSAVYPARSAAQGHAEADVHPLAATLGRPDGMYGWVKLAGERLADAVHSQTGVRVVCYRPFTLYGPHQGDEYPVTAIASRVVAREDPVVLWGSGQQRRDLVFIEDAAEAIGATHDRAQGALNICRGVESTFADIAHLVGGLTGHAVRLECDLSRPNGVASRVGDPRLLHRWYRAGTTPERGLSRLLEWLGAEPATRGGVG